MARTWRIRPRARDWASSRQQLAIVESYIADSRLIHLPFSKVLQRDPPLLVRLAEVPQEIKIIPSRRGLAAGQAQLKVSAAA